MSYPLAKAGSLRDRSVPCVHCGNRLVVSRWDHHLGFLYECPWCHRFHGKEWGFWVLLRVVFLSIVVGLMSFIVTMRPLNALVCSAFWFLWLGLGEHDSRLLIALPFVTLALNVYLVWQHNRDLNAEPIYTAKIV